MVAVAFGIGAAAEQCVEMPEQHDGRCFTSGPCVGLLEDGERILVPAAVLVRESELVEHHGQVRRDLERPFVLRDRLVVLPLIVEGPANTEVARHRQRIELLRALHLPRGLLHLSHREEAVAVPVMRRRVGRIDRRGAGEVALPPPPSPTRTTT